MNLKELKQEIYETKEDHCSGNIDFNGFSKFRINKYDSGYAWKLYRENPVPRYHSEMAGNRQVFHGIMEDCIAALLWYLENYDESKCFEFMTGRIKYR